jgi:hypothetical protein
MSTTTIDPTDTKRRAVTLSRYIGEEVTFKSSYSGLPKGWPRDLSGILLDVKRTRVLIDFGPSYGEWLFPITAILLPGCIEPLPGQRELFA